MLDENVKVGIDIIDAEHARLVDLLHKIDLSQARGHRRTVARLLRKFLASFDRHFDTESRLLRDLGCRDLDRRHSEFITSRSMMVSHPIDARDPEHAARIIEFARAWLADHIVRQDGAIADELIERAHRAGRLRRLLRFDGIPLRARIALMGLVPLVMMLSLATLSLSNLIGGMNSAVLLRDVVRLDERIGDLVFQLQEEGNRAIMVVGTPRRDVAHLKEQIGESDVAIAGFRASVADLRKEVRDKAVSDALDNAEASLSLLGRSRSDVQIGSYDVYSTIEYYDTIVGDLMEILPTLSRRLDPSDISARVGSYVFMLRARERAGAERALGTSLLSGVTVNVLSRDPHNIGRLATEQDSLGRTFETLTDRRFADAFRVAAVVSPMFANMRRSIETGEANGPTAQDWTDTSGLRIDRMRGVEKRLIGEVAGDVADFSAATRNHAVLFGGGIVAAVALSVSFIALLGWSILPPLHRVGAVLRRLADGERLVGLPDGSGVDEIAELERDVTLLRNRLVQGDLLEARRGTENADRLRTTLDGLPGIVFRIALADGAPPRVMAASHKLQQLTGLRDDEVLDRPLGSVLRLCLDPEDRISLLHVLRRIGRSPLDFECRLRRSPDGRARWIRILATPVPTGNGSIWDGVALDVTMAKQTEVEQGRLLEELDRLHRAQTTNRIAAGLGNDLGRLWRPLVENAEALADAVPAVSPLRERVRKILASAIRIRRLSEQLDLMLDGGREAAPIDLVGRLEERFAEVARALPPGLRLETAFSAHGTRILGDPAAIEHLVSNLATYLTETLGGEPGVLSIGSEVRTTESGGRRHLCIAIRDDRSALASRTLSKVLRLQTSRVQGVRGEDLSLAIVRMIVDGSRGWVQSVTVPQGGSVLEIFLPVWEGEEANVIRLERSARWPSHDQ